MTRWARSSSSSSRGRRRLSERRKASQRTRDAVKLRAERGQVPGGRVFGYRNVKLNGHTEREINEAEAAVVQRIFQRRGEGLGAFKIRR